MSTILSQGFYACKDVRCSSSINKIILSFMLSMVCYKQISAIYCWIATCFNAYYPLIIFAHPKRLILHNKESSQRPVRVLAFGRTHYCAINRKTLPIRQRLSWSLIHSMNVCIPTPTVFKDRYYSSYIARARVWNL